MPSPATLAGGASALKQLVGGKRAAAHPKRRQKRIVFSERQWEFTRTLIAAVSKGRPPPHFRRKSHRRKSFF